MFNGIKVKLKTIYFEFKYRNIEDDVCCCGYDMSTNSCASGLNACRSAKEYAITSAAES